MDRISGDFDTSFSEDKNLRGGSPTLQKNIESKQAAYKDANESLLAAIKEILKSSTAIKSEEWLKKSDLASATAIALWNVSVTELDTLLSNRIRYYHNHVFMVLGYVSVGLALSILFFAFVLRSISKPLADVQIAMEKVSSGQLEYEVPHITKRDEIGGMAKALQVFKNNSIEKVSLQEEQKRLEIQAEADKKNMMKKISNDFKAGVEGVISMVAAAATELYHTADQMHHTVSGVSKKSGNIIDISHKASENLYSISAAVEEMSASVGEISDQTNKSLNIVNDTVASSHQADKTTHILAESVQQISGVLQLIQNIAGQINLLALNATIESARAGDAGKGFAVVASEVKNLANQTTQATEEIAKQIMTIIGE